MKNNFLIKINKNIKILIRYNYLKMLAKNFLHILLFIIILFQGSLSGGEVDYSETSLKDMKNSIFNTRKEQIYYVGNLIKNKTIIGFSDLNSDKYTDIISYYRTDSDSKTSLFTFYENIFDNNKKKFNEAEKFTIKITKDEDIKNVTVRNLQILNYNDEPYALVSFNDGDTKLLHYVVKFETKTFGDSNQIKEITSNILILNKDEKKSIRLLFAEETEVKICYLQISDININCLVQDFRNNLTDPEKININNGTLSLKGGLAYVDLSGNCIPDIILSFESGVAGERKRTIEIFTSDKNQKYTLNTNITINSDDYGAFAIVNINDDKSGNKLPYLGILIPNIKTSELIYFKNQGTAHYDWATYHCGSLKDSTTNPLFNYNNNDSYSLQIEGESDHSLDDTYSTVIRIADFTGSSNPGIMVKQKKKEKYQISLYERGDKKFKYYTGIDISGLDEEDEEPIMGLFFDIDEAGTISFIVTTNKNNNYFFFNYRRNIYFVKSKLMNHHDKYYDINFGASYRYIVTDKKGDRHMDVGFQLAQTSDMNIPVPYGIMGLHDTNNYIEYFQTISGNILKGKEKISFEKSDEQDFKGNTPVIPNTQMMISKYYNKKNRIEWNVDLIVQPMEQIWLFLVVVIIVLIIVLSIIIYLHLKEVKEEQKETNKFKSWFA